MAGNSNVNDGNRSSTDDFNLFTKAALFSLLDQCAENYFSLKETFISDRVLLRDFLTHKLQVKFFEEFFQDKNSSERHKYKAHLGNFEGFIATDSRDFEIIVIREKQVPILTKKIIGLGTWFPENFLSLHLYFLIIACLELAVGKLDEPFTANKNVFFEALSDEIWVTANAYAIGSTYRKAFGQNTVDQPQLKIFAGQFFKSLCKIMPGMKNGDEIRFPCGSDKHAIYLTFARHNDNMLVRVDNLGTGIEYARVVTGKSALLEKFDSTTPDKGVIPTVISEINVKELANSEEQLTNFIFAVCGNVIKSTAEALEFIYSTDHLPKPPTTEFGYPPLDAQLVKNCVAAGFMVGTQYRFWLLDDTKYHQAYDWLVSSILSYVELEPIQNDPTEFNKLLAERKIQEIRLKQMRNTAYFSFIDQKLQSRELSSLHRRFVSFYGERKVKKTFGESEEGEDFDDLYTRLALIREREMRADRDSSRKDILFLRHMSADRMARDEHLHLFEHILYTERKPIDEDQLFLPVVDDTVFLRGKGRIDRILIRGQAGVGKTTFCYHLARKIAKQNHWVFVIPLRYLLDASVNLTDIDVIKKALEIELNEQESRLLEQLLLAEDQTQYWVLDGYDEVANLPKTHPLQQWLTKAFHKKCVIVTTRPRAIDNFDAERQIEMIGYLSEDVEKYVTRYFNKQPKKIATFMTFIKQQKQLGAIHRIPVILELMCWVWGDLTLEQGVNAIELSFTDLYIHVLSGLNRRYLMKNPELLSFAQNRSDEEIEAELNKTCLDPLLELAYQTFTANQLIFNGRDVANYLPHMKIDDRENILDEFGLTRCLRDNGYFDRKEFTFSHLTAQEFLMAKRWVQLFTSKDLNDVARAICLFTGRYENGYWVDCHKYDNRFEVVWGFVAGLLKDQSHYLQQFLDLITAPPRDQIGARHITLLLQVVGEANCLKEGTREYEEIMAWFNFNPGDIGFADYLPILARYPVVVKVLQKIWEGLWACKGEARITLIRMLSIVPLDLNGQIYNDLLSELEAEVTSKRNMVSTSVVVDFGIIQLSEEQLQQVIPVIFSKLPDAEENNAANIIFTLEKLYSKGQLSEKFQSELFDLLSACIETRDDQNITHAARVLGKMNLSEEKQLFLVNILLSRLSQAQFESPNDPKKWITEALGYITIPEKRQLEVVQLLFDIVEGKSKVGRCTDALVALSVIDIPDELRLKAIDTLLSHLDGEHTWRSATSGLQQISIPISYQNHVMDALLAYLKTDNANMKFYVLGVLKEIDIPKEYLMPVIDSLFNCLSVHDDRVRSYAAEALIGMNIPEEKQLAIVNALLFCLKTGRNSREAAVKALGELTIPEALKPKVIGALVNIASNPKEDNAIASYAGRSLGHIGVPLKIRPKLLELYQNSISRKFTDWVYAFYDLNSYCMFLSNNLPRYLYEFQIFIFYSEDAKKIHIAGTFNNWLNAIDGKIDDSHCDLWKMDKTIDNAWIINVLLLPGSYEFKYVIDEGLQWKNDPKCTLSINGNSEIKIELYISKTSAVNYDNISPSTQFNPSNSYTKLLKQIRDYNNSTSTNNLPPSQKAEGNVVEGADVNIFQKEIQKNYKKFKAQKQTALKFFPNEPDNEFEFDDVFLDPETDSETIDATSLS